MSNALANPNVRSCSKIAINNMTEITPENQLAQLRFATGKGGKSSDNVEFTEAAGGNVPSNLSLSANIYAASSEHPRAILINLTLIT